MAGGRPKSFKPEYVEQAKKLCLLGATDMDLADFFQVHVATLKRWKNEYPEFNDALKLGKEVPDRLVERSLYNRAVGYTYESEKVFQYQGEVVRAPVREHVPPDTTAQIFWLKNRRPDLWRDVHKHEVGGVGAFDSMSEAELADYIASRSGELGVSGSDAGDKASKKQPGPSGRLN